MSEPILPLIEWPEGIAQARIPANDNALREEAVSRPCLGVANDEATPVNGDVWLVGSSPTGVFASFSENDIALYQRDSWQAWAPVEGLRLVVNDVRKAFDGSGWVDDPASGSGSSRSPAIQSVASSATVTPTFSDDMVKITAQAVGLTLANPTGTAIPGLGMVIRIKDNGTARSISYGTQYRAIGVTLPTTTVISKTLYLAMVFNSDDTKWDVLAVGQEA